MDLNCDFIQLENDFFWFIFSDKNLYFLVSVYLYHIPRFPCNFNGFTVLCTPMLFGEIDIYANMNIIIIVKGMRQKPLSEP